MSLLAPWVALFLSGCGAAEPSCDERWVVDGDRSYCVQVAEGGAALRQGLKGAPRLGPREGMVLRYPVVSRACITMKGVDQPLDAWFLGDDGRVLKTACGLRPEASEPACQVGTRQVLETAPDPGCGGRLGTVVGRVEGLVGPVPHAPWKRSRCSEASEPVIVDGRLHLVVHRSSMVEEATVVRLLERAQAYYAQHGLWLTVDEVHELPPALPAEEGAHGGKASDALLVGTRLELLERLDAEGLLAEAAQEAEQAKVDAVAQDVVLGPYRALVSRLAADGELSSESGPSGRVHVVFLQHIAQPGSIGAGLFQELRGFTVSPWLEAPTVGDDLMSYLALPDAFSPVAVVGVDPVDHLGPNAVDVTLAHELGHAMGLPHVPGEDDLMQEGVHRCVPSLRPEQAEALRGHERL